MGLNTGLSGQPEVASVVAAQGMTHDSYLHLIGETVALLHGIAGSFVPLIMVSLMTRFFGKNRSFGEGLAIWKFALFAGLAFTIPSNILARFLGPEFPSLLGALVGLCLVVPATRAGLFQPKKPWAFPDEEEWDAEWRGELQIDVHDHAAKVSGGNLIKAWSPYLIVAALLVITRTVQPIKALITSDAVTISWANIFNSGIGAKSQPLYLPGFIFVVTVVLCYAIYRMNQTQIRQSLGESGRTVLGAASALVFAVPMVQVFINSKSESLAQMPIVLADGVSTLFGSLWPLIAPTIGGLGAFIAGSNTISNMLFAFFQFSMAQKIGATEHIVVALQAVGGAAGNMICVHNVVFASATVGLLGKEGSVIRKTLAPMIGYALFAGALGLVMIGGSGITLGAIFVAVFAVLMVWLIFVGMRSEALEKES